MGKNTSMWLIGGAVAFLLFFRGKSMTASSNNTVSDAQLQQTQNFEGFSKTAYPDGSDSNGNQLYSIGYGHSIQPGESYLLSGSISQSDAQALLISDMQNVVDTINNSGQSFTQGQFDALADFGYNAGTGALAHAIDAFSNGASAVPVVILKYVYWHPVPGGPAVLNQNLVDRRNVEVQTWNS